MSPTCVIAAAGLLLATGAGAGAGLAPSTPTASYELRWRRAPGAEACIDARALAGAVSALLGREVFDIPGTSAGSIEGQVRPSASGWHVVITIRGPGGVARGARELELEGADCRAIDEPLALVLALIVDPDAGWGAPAIAPPTATTTTATLTAVRAAPWGVDAAVSGAAGIGVWPDPSAGVRVVFGFDAPRLWPVALGLSWWAPATLDVGGAAISLRRWQARAAVCTPAAKFGRARLSGCGGVEVARLDVRGIGFESDRQAQATMAVAAVSGRVTVDLSRPGFVVAELGAEAAPTRPRFLDDAGRLVYRPAPASMFGALGVGVRF